MCGRYVLIEEKPEVLYARFDIQNTLEDWKPNYNITPGMNMPVVVSHSPNSIERMRWGLIPYWAKDKNIGYKMINARAETIAIKPSFNKPLRTQRCLIPANGFYEWQKKDTNKIPYFIHLPDNALFAFAGIYDVWQDTDGQEVKSYSIITTQANSAVSPIHDRMPVILDKDEERDWLNSDIAEPEHIIQLLDSFSDAKLQAHGVSTQVNSPKNNSKDLIDAVAG
jgi:putative SOS response-associated peptidase YedK